jgi:hypothetical protein
MLSVTTRLNLSVIMINVIMLNVIMLNVMLMLNIILLCVTKGPLSEFHYAECHSA